ncbi:TonB-dependent receptor [Hyphococcus sp.]|uniref:TonB-dependent receptor n=1 Tax=Hyphococcus sp. TaxID=2038636 RepID=UPI003CCB9FB1
MRTTNTKKTQNYLLLTPALSLSFFAFSPDIAHAQTEPAASQGGLDEIVVKARKREESLQDVPVVATVISEDEIERRNLTSIERIAGSTPNLFVARASNGSGATISMRGIGSQSTSIALPQSTAIVVDGVYYGSGFILNEAMFDLGGIEILKGPQALFFGKNATAGVISLNTASPTDELEIIARAGYEFNAKEISGEAIVSGPLSESLKGRIAFKALTQFGSLFDNQAVATPVTTVDTATGDVTTRTQFPNAGDGPGTTEYSLRGTLVWEPTDRFSGNLKASWTSREDEQNAWNYVPVACGNGTGFTQVNPAVPCNRDFITYVPNSPTGIAGKAPFSRPDGSSYNEYESFQVTAALNYDADFGSFTSISNFNTFENLWGLNQNVHSPTSFIAATQRVKVDTFSNETRFQSTFSGPLNFLLGGYYQNSEMDFLQSNTLAGLTDSSQPADLEFLNLLRPGANSGETLSFFGQVVWDLTSQLELAGGARYIHETNEGTVVSEYVHPALRGLFPQDLRISADQEFDDVTPEVTLTYRPANNLTIYGAYKTAYKSGGFSTSAVIVAATAPSDLTFEPEEAEGFNFGFKSTLFDNQFRLNIDAYRTEYTDLQVDFFDSATFQFITTNAGSAVIKGVEVEMEYAPAAAPGLFLSADVNYNDAEYQEYIAPCYTGQSIAAGCNTTFGTSLGQDLSGAPTAVAPKWTVSGGGVYTVDVARSLELELGTNIQYVGDYFASNFATPLSFQDSYINVDASIILRQPEGPWQISLIGRNLTNSFRISSHLDLPNSGFGTGTNAAIPADSIGLADNPRTVMVQISMEL